MLLLLLVPLHRDVGGSTDAGVHTGCPCSAVVQGLLKAPSWAWLGRSHPLGSLLWDCPSLGFYSLPTHPLLHWGEGWDPVGTVAPGTPMLTPDAAVAPSSKPLLGARQQGWHYTRGACKGLAALPSCPGLCPASEQGVVSQPCNTLRVGLQEAAPGFPWGTGKVVWVPLGVVVWWAVVPLSPPVPSSPHGCMAGCPLPHWCRPSISPYSSWGAAPEFNFPCGFILGDNIPTLLSGVTCTQLVPTVGKELLWG